MLCRHSTVSSYSAGNKSIWVHARPGHSWVELNIALDYGSPWVIFFSAKWVIVVMKFD
ncbi:hypothetical protein L1049_003676 [Liquidambar formosana]|uniref:Uncharacterized protein n=1 Tax=Liquidambar formosana TaxID=63359 RepID=A0AAP0RQI9_LIQFO